MNRHSLNPLRATATGVLVAVLAALLLISGATPASATGKSRHRPSHPSHARSITVGGQVVTPASYSAADLAALPQTTLPDQRERRARPDLTGVLLESLVTAAGPQTPAVKNADLRVSIVVAGKHGAVAATLAELQPRFGNHPALLVTQGHGRHARTDLVFPGDRGTQRTVHDVRSIKLSVADPALPTGLPTGALMITTDRGSVLVTARQLAKLPQITRTVTFASGSGQQTRVETGPTLAAGLRAAHVRTTPTSVVAAIADDSYVSTVTPGEATSGRRTLLLSLVEDGTALTQPRLVTDGDIAGGRYVSGLLGLQVTNTCR